MGDTNRYIQAAKDGCIDILKNGSKRELNKGDEDGMTSVHWAAFCGRIDALRVIVGRGGDVDKQDTWSGGSALHHAAVSNHIDCVSFLVNFGVNLWTVDLDGRHAMDAAAVRGHTHIVQYLDSEMANQILLNSKQVMRRKQKANEAIERLRKRHASRTAVDQSATPPAAADMEKEGVARGLDRLERKFKDTLRSVGIVPTATDTNRRRITRPETTTNLPTYSDYAGTVKAKTGSVNQTQMGNVIFGERMPMGDESIAGGGTNDSGISGDLSPEMPGLFDRPGFGTMAFRGGPLSAQLLDIKDDIKIDRNENLSSFLNDCAQTDAVSDKYSSLERFLEQLGMAEYLLVFLREEITLESLRLLSEGDLKALNIPLGPRKLIADALTRCRNIDVDCGKIGGNTANDSENDRELDEIQVVKL